MLPTWWLLNVVTDVTRLMFSIFSDGTCFCLLPSQECFIFLFITPLRWGRKVREQSAASFFFDLNVSPENISRCNRQRLFFPLFNQRIPSVASRRFDKRKMMFRNCFLAPLLIGILSAERQKTGWCYQSFFKVVPFPDGNRICSSDPRRLTCHYETGEDIVEYPLTKASDYCHQ